MTRVGAIAERLVAYWQGREESALCRSLAEHLEQALNSPVLRNGVDVRADPEALERALTAVVEVDPVTRELVRKLTLPSTDSPEGPRLEGRKPAWVRSPVDDVATEPLRVAPQTVINAGHNRGIVVGRDIRGQVAFNPSAAAEPQQEEARQARGPKARDLIRILFLGANPRGATPLRLDQEVREIDAALRQAEHRDSFEFRQQWAVRTVDLQKALLQHKPQILHFSGHGERSDVLILEDEFGGQRPVRGEVLSRLLALFSRSIRCVVLNACHSQNQAEAIAASIDCVVGMSKAIGDEAAIRFSASFYQALAYGQDVRTAFELGCLQIQLEELNEENTPKLTALRQDPSEILFTSEL